MIEEARSFKLPRTFNEAIKSGFAVEEETNTPSNDERRRDGKLLLRKDVGVFAIAEIVVPYKGHLVFGKPRVMRKREKF